jgi:GT2 family glycosyltransferase
VRNDENMGLVHACNTGAAAALGHYVLFLDFDTLVLPGWLDELVDTFSNFPDAGLVGAKLLDTDGFLLEAGRVFEKDGSAHARGRDDDPFKPEYNHVSAVDYCSAVSMIAMKETFLQAGGFDTRYAVSFWDHGLALRIRAMGKLVLYQPLSVVIHFEVTAGAVGTEEGWLADEGLFRATWSE